MSEAVKLVPEEEEVQSSSEQGTKEKIFIIDDDLDLLELVKISLKKEFEVVSINTASEAVTRATEERPNLILLDLHMPNIDGYEVLKLLKGHPYTTDIPIVCMSADDGDNARSKSEVLGSSGFLQKPFNRSTLAKDLKGLLTALSSTLTSKDKTRSFSIAYNEKEKTRLIKEKIIQKCEEGIPICFLSWQKGEDFLEEEELKTLVEENKVVFLQIKPNLIVKYPYLQDLSPVFEDIFEFLEGSENDYHLIFDEPRNLINVYDKKSALSKSFLLANLLRHHFLQFSIFNTRPQSNDAKIFLHKLARVFVGGS